MALRPEATSPEAATAVESEVAVAIFAVVVVEVVVRVFAAVISVVVKLVESAAELREGRRASCC